MSASDINPKILFLAFLRPGETPVENTPPVFFSPKIFQTKNSAWKRTALGWVRGGVGSAGDGSGGPLAAWQGDPCPLTLGCPFAARGGPVSGPQRRRFIVPVGGQGAQFRLPVSPAGEVLSSPQMSVKIIKRYMAFFRGR